MFFTLMMLSLLQPGMKTWLVRQPKRSGQGVPQRPTVLVECHSHSSLRTGRRMAVELVTLDFECLFIST